MSKRSRARSRPHTRPQLPAAPPGAPRPNTPADPERLLLDQIASGELDPHLIAISDAVGARLELLRTVSSAKAIAMLNVGDRVRINRHARPRYLQGIHGEIIDVDDRTAIVRLRRPVGRFTSGEIRCPPLALDRLDPAA